MVYDGVLTLRERFEGAGDEGAAAAVPLVLLHGFLCAGRFFDPNIAVLARRRRVITVDLPGFGDSADSAAADSIDAMAAQVLATLAAHGHRRFHLLGHSMGGMVALQAALLAPSQAPLQKVQLESLIVYASNCSGDLPDRFESFADSKRRLQEDFAAAKERIAATWFSAGADSAHFELVRRCGAAVPLATALMAIDAMAAFDAAARVAEIAPPVLIISPEFDRTYTARCQLALAARLPRARREVMRGCAHCAHLEDEARFNQIVNDWCAAC